MAARARGWRGRGEKNIRGRCREHDIAHRVTNNVLLRLKTVTGEGGYERYIETRGPFLPPLPFSPPFSLPPLLSSSPPRFLSFPSFYTIVSSLHFIFIGDREGEEMYSSNRSFEFRTRFRHVERSFQRVKKKNKIKRKPVRLVSLNSFP